MMTNILTPTGTTLTILYWTGPPATSLPPRLVSPGAEVATIYAKSAWAQSRLLAVSCELGQPNLHRADGPPASPPMEMTSPTSLW